MNAERTHGTVPEPQPSGDRISRRGTVIAFDFGERRLGVAIGDSAIRIAHPLETIDEPGHEQRFARIAALVAQWAPAIFVVGLPINVDGSEHALAATVRAFAAELTRRFGISTALIDERFTSAQATSVLQEAGVRGRAQKAVLDQVAAKSILEDYFAHEQPGA